MLAQRLLESITNTAFDTLAPVRIYEKGDKYILKFLVPGVAKENVDITLEANEFKLRAKIEHDKKEYEDVIADEFENGAYVRTLRLPHDVDSNSVVAKLDSGVLTVEINKSEDKKPKKITVA